MTTFHEIQWRPDFDPRGCAPQPDGTFTAPHSWRFDEYYKYRFTYHCTDHPEWHASYGGDPSQIYRYTVSATPMTWHDITEGTCDTPQTIREALLGDHEFAYLYTAPADPHHPEDATLGHQTP